FHAWEAHGMPMGNMYEVALTVEGWQSSGWADVYQNDLIIGGPGGGNPGDGGGGTPPGNGTVIQAESMTIGGQYANTISSPFNGVALYANDDHVKFNHNFSSGSSSFSLRGASDNDNNMAR